LQDNCHKFVETTGESHGKCKQTVNMNQEAPNLKHLLPYGAMAAIAVKMGTSNAAVSQALKRGRPGNRIVQEAVRWAKESGALATAQALASLSK
jgi:hypothetical protein